MTTTIFIASPLSPDLVERIRAVDPVRTEVIFEPDLLPRLLAADALPGELKELARRRTA